ncbi:hypothetical protein AARAC_011398 [Aspergillus arachidicola]|uniref:Stress-associated endoplasmic reticulum protein n=1 Tax=Aspergillus arachidicola TaxID=656916 RepID=A0A2G7FUX7_9EURO|nr:hypothetical protein AARAC_011398 [Aspergillus arachidicola]
MAQTPQQRKANEKYAKSEAAKRGKGKTATKQKQNSKSPVSTGWVGMSRKSRIITVPEANEAPTVVLAFAVCGGLAFEALRIVPELWSAAVAMFNRKLA